MLKVLFFILIFPVTVWGLDDFTHESEFSSIRSRGNTPYETYLTKVSNKLVIDKMHDVTFGGHYSYGSIGDNEVEIARNWDINAKYLSAISVKTYAFLGAVVEGNEFAGFSERNNIDLGFRTTFIENDDITLSTEYGYRQTVEVPTDGSKTNKDQKVRLYGKIDEKLTQSASYAFWVEYIPNFTRPEDYMINFEPSLRVAINNIFSLKVAYKGMYDNMPAIASRKYYDENYTTSLLAKF
jgi:putative salt-induced outer membrane protein YdiY